MNEDTSQTKGKRRETIGEAINDTLFESLSNIWNLIVKLKNNVPKVVLIRRNDKNLTDAHRLAISNKQELNHNTHE